MSKPSRVQPFSESTFNPATLLATGISVGLHVLLWVVQPALPSGSTSANNPRTVGFVQLTPEELSRLPEYSLPQLKLPPLPPPRTTNILPPLPPLQSSTKLPPIPIQPTYIPPVSQVSPSPNNSPKSSSEIHVPSRSETSAKDKLTNRSSRETAPSASEQLIDNSRPVKGSPSNISANENSNRRINSSPQPLTNESKGLFRDSVDRVLNGQNTTDRTERSIQEEFMARGNQRDERFVNGLPGGVQEGMVPQTPNNGQSKNRSSTTNNQTQPRENSSTENADRLSQSTQQSFQSAFREAEILSSYGYSSTDTTERDASGNLRKWLEKIQQSVPNVTITRFPDTILVKSPIAVNLPRVSQASVTVLVEPNGKIVGEPELIRSTGYSKLNQAVIAELKKRSFRSTGKYEIYMYQLEIDRNGLPPASGAASNS